VISFAKGEDTAPVSDPVPEDAPLRPEGKGANPGFAGAPPQRPHGKLATPEAGMAGAEAREAEATARTRREEVRDDTGGQGADIDPSDPSSALPATPLQVGDGRQADDADVPSAFEPTEEENEEEAKKKK
jgi:peptide/nickel transport system ATP-binding protein